MITSRPAAAVDIPGTGGRATASGYVDGLAVAKTEDSPRQRPGALLALRVHDRPSRAIAAHLELRMRVGGPFEGGHPGFYNLVHTFQNRSPAWEASEAYADLHLERADLRIGIQKLAWGKLDGIPPTDIVNPRDFHDPIVQDAEERKIGIPAIVGTYFLPAVPRLALAELRAALVYVPLAVPPRLPLLEERWFPPTTIVGSTFRIPKELLNAQLEKRGLTPFLVTQDQIIPLSFRTQNHRPPLRFTAGGIGLRVGGTWRESDFDLYHYSGPATEGDVDLRTELVSDSPPGFLPLGPPSNQFRLRSPNTFRQAHDVLHMVGGDWTTALGGATVRAEAAFFFDRPFLRLGSDLTSPQALAALPLGRIFNQIATQQHANVPLGPLFVDRDAVEWGIGADYLWRGWLPLAQVTQIALFEPAPELVIGQPETRLMGSLRRRFLGERLELEVRGIYAIERESWFVLPRASYQVRDDLRVRLGYLAVGGQQESLIGQYQNNDEVVLQARYSF